jgi:hypothetical protein
MFIVLIMWHHNFTAKPLGDRHRAAVVRVLLRDDLFWPYKVVPGPLHARKQ